MRANTIILYNVADKAKTGDMAGDLVFGVVNNDGSTGPLNLAQIFGYSIQAFYPSGTPAGVLKVQSSNDGVAFCDIPGAAFTVSGTGSFLWNVPASNYLYSRLVWTASGGSSGTLSALAYVRGV